MPLIYTGFVVTVITWPWKAHKLEKTQHRKRKIRRTGEGKIEQGSCCRKWKQTSLLEWNKLIIWRFQKDFIWGSERHHMPEMVEYLHWALLTQERFWVWCCPWNWKCSWPHGPTALQGFVSSGALSPTPTTAETPCATNTTCCQDAPVLPVLTEDTDSCGGPLCPYYTCQWDYLQESMKRCPVVMNSVFSILFCSSPTPEPLSFHHLPLPFPKESRIQANNLISGFLVSQPAEFSLNGLSYHQQGLTSIFINGKNNGDFPPQHSDPRARTIRKALIPQDLQLWGICLSSLRVEIRGSAGFFLFPFNRPCHFQSEMWFFMHCP